MKKTILIVGTGDTKSEELLFMKQCIFEQGGEAVVMDVGVLGEPDFEVDYSRHDVAVAANTTNQAIIDLGFPKFIISTISFSHLIPPERLSPDLMMILWSGGLYGLNSICKASLSQACGAVLGAANAVQIPKFDKPVVGMTSLGSSALKYMKLLKSELEKRGYELAVFHTTGQGGRALENLSKQKKFVCVMDFSLQEVANEMKGSIVTSGADRMENAGKMGIPLMVAPGAIDLIDTPTWKDLTEDLQNREYHAHNRLIASVTMHAEERRQMAQLISKKLAMAKGKTAFFLPLQGIEEWDRKGNPLHDAEGHLAFCEEIKNCIPAVVQFIEIDAHINDQAFADAVVKLFDEWVKAGIVEKGKMETNA